MKLLCSVLAAFATLVATPQESTAPTGGITWGSAVNGLRLGIAFGSDPSKPTIRVVFENVSGRVQEVPLGYSNGRGSIFNLKFIARAGDGKMREAADIGTFYPVEGLVQRVSVSLEPVDRRQHELVFALKDIFVYSSPTDDTFENLLNRGYSLRVTFEAQREDDLTMAGKSPLDALSHRWLGKAESAEVSRSPALLAAGAFGGQSSHEPYLALKQLLGLGDAELARLIQGRPHAAMEFNDSQRRKVEEVAKVLNHAWVYNAVELGLISKERWPGGTLCYDEIDSRGLGLIRSQVDELRRLRSQPRTARFAVLTKLQLERLALYEAQLQLLNQTIDLGLVRRPTAGEPLCH